MTANPYPSLGWNPVPGLPDSVSALQSKVQAAADTLNTCYEQITSLLDASSSWQGDAASAFRDTVDGDLKLAVMNAGHSLEKAAKSLKGWEGDLSSHRDLAKKYDDAAREKKAASDSAKKRYDEAKADPDLKLGGKEYPSQAEADAATDRLRAAEQALNDATKHSDDANAAYEDVLKKARELESIHIHCAKDVAEKLDNADDKLAPKEPGWFGKTLSAIGDGLKKFGELVLDHAGTIGAIAGVLALLPTPLAPVFAGVAVAASAVSMAKNLASEDFRDALTGKYGWKEGIFAGASMVGDTLGMVPGVGALARAGGEAGLAAAVAREGGEAMSLGSKMGKFGSEIVPAFRFKALDAATESTSALQHALNGANVAANMESSLESIGVLPKDGLGHDGTETAKGIITGTGVKSGTMGFVADVAEMMRGIRL
ncbi:putative T7SS-secreted protein [Streptomyces sp. NPDC059080]|uniref:putative T7SS-secreted protein n=1 Tax=Streptomyces sp. NPDC059080 TaxID=3346718 RepID=UPI0036C1108E